MDADDAAEDEVIVLPWWRNPANIAILVVAVLFLAGAVGYSLGARTPEQVRHNEVDVGFLQDMRIHHDQAVVLARVYLAAEPDGDPRLATIAREIEIAQTFEAGRFVQLLRLFGEAETNETEVAMAWMGHPMPLEEMHGMASEADIERLAEARGSVADELFATLMIAHHQGGVEMASHAAENGSNSEVVLMARKMAEAQRGEIAEMRRILTGV